MHTYKLYELLVELLVVNWIESSSTGLNAFTHILNAFELVALLAIVHLAPFVEITIFVERKVIFECSNKYSATGMKLIQHHLLIRIGLKLLRAVPHF